MLGPIAHRCYRKDTVRACKIAVLTTDRHRNGCQCSTTAALPASRGPRCTDGASDIPIAPADPGAQLLASSFPGGFRTPARSRPRRAQCRAGIRNPSQKETQHLRCSHSPLERLVEPAILSEGIRAPGLRSSALCRCLGWERSPRGWGIGAWGEPHLRRL